MTVAGGMVAAVALASAPTTAEAAAAARSAGPALRGIDISAYQHADGPINWRRLARQGIRFAAIKVTEGTYYTNRYYWTDERGAARAGLAVMPYVFANPAAAGGAATASFAVRAARSRRGRARVVDLENDPYATSDCYGVGRRRMVGWITAFTRRARALTGLAPIIYTTAAWWTQCTGSTGRFRADPLWLAAYGAGRPSAPPPWGRWAFWQYTDEGFLPGVGPTDLDYYEPAADIASLHPAVRAKPRHKRTSRQKHRTSRQKHRVKEKRKDRRRHRPKHKRAVPDKTAGR
jgi:lysozyme